MRCCKNAAKTLTGNLQLLMLVIGLVLLMRSAEAEFNITEAHSYLLNEVYYADLKISYAFNAELLEAMDNGLALDIAIKIEVLRERTAWFDQSIAALTVRYRVEKHALTGHYIIHNLNSGTSTSYKNYQTLIDHFGNIQRLPLIDALLLDSKEHYYLSAKTYLLLNYLPVPMRLRAYLTPSWDMESPPFQWRLLSPYNP